MTSYKGYVCLGWHTVSLLVICSLLILSYWERFLLYIRRHLNADAWCHLLVGKCLIALSVRLGCNACGQAIWQISGLTWETFETAECTCRRGMFGGEVFMIVVMYVMCFHVDVHIEGNSSKIGRIVSSFAKTLSVVLIDGTEASTEMLLLYVGSKVKAYMWSWSQRVQFIFKRAI